MASHPVWQTFDRFLAGELPVDELEQWLFSSDDIAEELAPDEHAALLAVEFGADDADRLARGAVSALYEAHRPGRLAHDRAERIARGMLSGEITTGAGARALARLREEGHDWIPEAFDGIVRALDDVPSMRREGAVPDETEALAARLSALRERERLYRAPVLTAARRLLERLG